MTATIKIHTNTVHAIGPKALTKRNVVPLLRRVAFIGFLSSVFWAVPHALDVAHDMYTDIKTPSVDAPLPVLSAVWLANDEPLVWEEAAKDAFKEKNDLETAVDFDAPMLLDLFETLQMTPEQKLMVAVNYKVASERYILGSQEPQLKEFFEHRNTQSRQWLDQAWEQIQQQSLSGQTAALKANDAVNDHLNHYNISLQQWNEKNQTAQQHSLIDLFKQERDSVHRTNQSAPPVVHQTDLIQAQEMLLKAVDETGLAALVVSGSVAHDEQLMAVQAQLLEQTNVDLRRITGFDGGVLGVNRRVVLNNEHLNSNGTMQRMSNGYIWVNSNWDTLGHEWFHALDSAQIHFIKGRGRVNYLSDSIERGSLGWLKDPYDLQDKQRRLINTLQNTPLPIADHPQFINEVRARILHQFPAQSVMMLALDQAAQEAVNSGASSTRSSWLHYRMRAVEIAQNYSLNDWAIKTQRDPNRIEVQREWEKEKEYATSYLQFPTEKIAFMFQGYLEALAKNGDITVLSGDLAGQPGVYVPTVVESAKQKPIWNTYFSSLKQWWNADQQQRLPSMTLSKATIVEKRATAVQTPPPMNAM